MSKIYPVFSSEPVFANHVPALETGFTPWNDDSPDLFSIFDSSPPVYPLEGTSGLEKTNSGQIENQILPIPGLIDTPLNRIGSNGFVAFSDHKDDQRKRRKISNRESAQRSRRKKQKHLEDVTCELNQLKNENRELKNRLRYVLNSSQRAKMENDHLRLEHDVLLEKLLNLRKTSMLRQIRQSSTCATCSCVYSTVVTVQQNPSMIN